MKFLNKYPIAKSRKVYNKNKDWYMGYRTSSGNVYIKSIFNTERKPSLCIQPKGYYHCFSTGGGGSNRELGNLLKETFRRNICYYRRVDYVQMNFLSILFEEIPF